MNLTGLLPAVLADPAAAEAVSLVRTRGAVDIVGPAGVRAPLLAAMTGARASGASAGAPLPVAVSDAGARPLVVVTATGRDADDLAASLRCYLPADDVAVLPAWETLPHERLSPRADTVARRLAVFRRLAHPARDAGQTGPIRVLVMPVRALLQPVVAGLGELAPVELNVGERADLAEVADRLVGAAYTRVDMVERRGEFAVRGGILDVFPPTEDHPLRVEFWGDEVEEVRWFAVADQRSLEVAERGVWAPPCREILLTPEVQLRNRGNRVVIWAVDQGDEGVPRAVDGVEVRYLPCPLPARSGRSLLRFARAAPAAFARWVAAARSDRPDVLHVQCFGPNGVYAQALSLMTRTPLVLSSHGETFMDADGSFDASALLRRSLRAALRGADAVTACSGFTAADLVDRFGLRPGGARIVPNGIDVRESGGPAPSWLPASYVLGVGRLVHNKGFDLLVDAFAESAPGDVRLVIGGDGPEREALQARVHERGVADRVILPGRLSRPEIVAVMARATALVVPSRIEAFGITILEGWRAGIPVVATQHGGPPEFVEDGVTGLLVDPEDRTQLSSAISRLVGDPGLSSRLGAAGRAQVVNYTWASVAERYEEIYRDVA